MNIIFLGTPSIAVPSLEALAGSHHKVISVITQPDQKSGRGMNVSFSPVKQAALRYSIECLQPEKIGDGGFLDLLEEKNADLFCVAAYAQKLPDRLLEMTKYGCINMHPSLLPAYRGSGPLRGPILNGDPVTGVTIMQVNSQWDAGDILLQESFKLDPEETSQSLEEKCAVLGGQMMLKAVDGLEAGTIKPCPQDADKATYLKQIKKEDGIIDFGKDAVSIERQIRACIPWPSAYTFLNGKVFKIWKAQTDDSINTQGTVPGTVVFADRNNILISTGSGCLKPLEVQIEGKKRMDIADFLRGARIEAGTVFGNGTGK